jgi:hypothetical protein
MGVRGSREKKRSVISLRPKGHLAPQVRFMLMAIRAFQPGGKSKIAGKIDAARVEPLRLAIAPPSAREGSRVPVRRWQLEGRKNERH